MLADFLMERAFFSHMKSEKKKPLKVFFFNCYPVDDYTNKLNLAMNNLSKGYPLVVDSRDGFIDQRVRGAWLPISFNFNLSK